MFLITRPVNIIPRKIFKLLVSGLAISPQICVLENFPKENPVQFKFKYVFFSSLPYKLLVSVEKGQLFTM